MIDRHTSEKGMVSITVTVILMLVISITVLSFAQIIRREQRQALDSQLSSQAFYAAESGINQARTYIQETWIKDGRIPPSKTICGPDDQNYPASKLPMTINSDTNTSFSCLLVTGSPKSLKYDLSPSAGSKVFPITVADSANPISSLEVDWTPSTKDAPRTDCSTAINAPAELPKATSWPCRGYGIVRIDLVPAGSFNREEMMGSMFTAFLSPANIGGNRTVSYNGLSFNVNNGLANQGARPVASCTDDSCKITVTNLNGRAYYARVSTLYRETSLSVVAKDSNGVDLDMMGAQVLLDATGRAQDVLRRIQVRVPLVGDGIHPDYGVQTTDSMCKLLTTFNGDRPIGDC